MTVSSFDSSGRDGAALAQLGRSTAPAAGLEPISLKFYAGSIVLALLAIACLAGALLQRSVPFAVIGALLLPVPVYQFVLRALSRGSIETFERGVVLRFGSRVVAFPFEELLALTVSQQEQLDNGVRVGVMRRVFLRTSDAKQGFAAFAADGKPDAVGVALAALVRGAVDAALRSIQVGRALAGKGWRLDQQGLSAGPATVALPEITSAAIYQRQVSLWRGAEEEPFFSVPEASQNALVLHDLVRRRLEQKGGQPQRESAGFGRVLFEKGSGTAVVVGLALVGLLIAAVGVPLLRSADQVAGFMCIGGGLLFGFGAIFARRTRLRVHERGIVQDTLFGRRTMRYADIERLTYAATRHYRNGVYAGTSLEMKCQATGMKPISISTNTRGTEADLDSLRDHVAGLVSVRLQEKVAKDGEAAWAGGLRLSAKGVRFNRPKTFGKGEEVFRPWQELRYSIAAGYFHLFEPDQKKPALSVECGAENFYPGFLVFQRLGGFN